MRMTSKHNDRDERGATMVLVAAMIVCLLAAAGIGIDTTSMAYQRSRVQHAADASALAIAQTCKAGSCESSLANDLLAKNAAGGGRDHVPSVSISSTAVTVSMTKDVDTMFFGLLGIGSKAETAVSTASWNTSPTSGSVIPFLVSLCEFTHADIGEDTFLDSNTNDRFKTNVSDYGDEPQSVLEPANLDELVDCAGIPDGVDVPANTRMIKGGLWISTNGGCNSSLSDGKAALEIGDNPTEAGFGKLCGFNAQQTTKYGDGGPQDLAANKTALLAVYAPSKNFHYGGVLTEADGTDPTSKIEVSGSSVEFSGKIVGFAPFYVTGFRFGASPHQEGPCVGTCPNGSVGIWGRFVSEIHPDADYEVGGPDIGAVVKLID